MGSGRGSKDFEPLMGYLLKVILVITTVPASNTVIIYAVANSSFLEIENSYIGKSCSRVIPRQSD